MLKLSRQKILLWCITLSSLFSLFLMEIPTLAEPPIHPYRWQIHGIHDPAALANIKLRLQNTAPAYPDAANQISEALAAYGYLSPTIQSRLYKNEQEWVAYFVVNPGPMIKIRRIQISVTGEGTQELEKIRTRHKLLIKEGAPFISPLYEKAKRQLLQIANSHGYLHAHFVTHQVFINKIQNTATIFWIFDTGNRYYFGPVSFSKNPFQEKLLNRYVPFKPGQAYAPEKIFLLEQRLNSSPYFQYARVEPLLTDTDQRVIPIKVSLEAKKSQAYLFGLGYGTDTGARATLGWERRYLNSRGDQLQSLLQISPIQSNALIRYIIPGRDPTIDQYYIAANGQHFDTVSAESSLGQLSFGKLQMRRGWQIDTAIKAQIEDSYDKKADVDTLSKLIYPNISFKKIKASDPIYSLHGYKLQATFRGTSNYMYLSDVSFVQALLEGQYIHSLAKQRRVIFKSSLGYTAVSNFNRLPVSLKFYAGGDQSIRGYPYQWLGPARYLATGSIEFQQPIRDKWFGAIYYDAGSAFNANPSPFIHSVGAGVVIVTPLGPISLSIARPLSSPRHDAYRIVFNMGPDFS